MENNERQGKRREGEREKAHLFLVTAETRCLLLHDLDLGKMGGYATAGWIYIKRVSAGDGCRIRRHLRCDRAREAVANTTRGILSRF